MKKNLKQRGEKMRKLRSALFLGIFAIFAVGFLMTACGGVNCDDFCTKIAQCSVENGTLTQAQADAAYPACVATCDAVSTTSEEEDCVDGCANSPCNEYFQCLAICGITI